MLTRDRATRSPPEPAGLAALALRRAASVGALGLAGCVGLAPPPPARDEPSGSTGSPPASTTLDPSPPPATSTTSPATSTTRDPAATETTDAADESSGAAPVTFCDVRLMHLGIDVPRIDLRTAPMEPPTVGDVPFGHSSGYAAVPSGDYAFELGLTELGPTGPTLETPVVTLVASRAYTVVAIGTLSGDPPLQALVLEDDASDLGPETVRATFVHAAPALGELDVLEISSGETRTLRENSSFSDVGRLPNLPSELVELGIDGNDDGIPDFTFKLDAAPLAGVPTNVYLTHDAREQVVLMIQWPDDTVLTFAAG